jgi:hypothetical protein
MLQQFLSGGVFVACVAIGLHFLRLYRKTNDRLFVFFAIAFVILAGERVLLSVYNQTEYAIYVYAARLLAYLFIIAAIVDKNRRN